MKIIFIRHPETTWNVEKRLQGSREGKITINGKQLAQKFAEDFAHEQRDISIIYHADNMRTEYLAKLIAGNYSEEIMVIKENLLNERSFGEYEGRYEKEVGDMTGYDPENYENRYSWKPPKGESHEELEKRVVSLIQKLEKYSPHNYEQNKKNVCVTSGAFIKMLSKWHKNLTLKQTYNLKIRNLDSYEIEI